MLRDGNFYFSISIYLIVAFLFVNILCLVSWIFSHKKNKDVSKLSTYETGCLTNSDARVPLNIHFFTLGILFLILDLEIVILFPWIMNYIKFGYIGFYKLQFIIHILSISFLYEWYNNILDWHLKTPLNV